MQWLANNYLWLLAIVIIPAVGFLLKRYVFTEPDGSNLAARAHAPESHPSNSAVTSGNITNIVNVQPLTPAPVTPITFAPDIGVPKPVKPRPNMKMTGAKVIRINEYDPGRLVEDSTGRAEAIIILFTNEAREGQQNVGGEVKASLVFEDNSVEILRIIGAWMGENWESATFNVDDVHKLVVGFRLRPAGVIALEMRRQPGGHYRLEPHSVSSFQTVRVRLTHASSGDFLYAGRFRVTLEPELAIVPIVDGQA